MIKVKYWERVSTIKYGLKQTLTKSHDCYYNNNIIKIEKFKYPSHPLHIGGDRDGEEGCREEGGWKGHQGVEVVY